MKKSIVLFTILLSTSISFGQTQAIEVNQDANVAIGANNYSTVRLSVGGQIRMAGSGGTLQTNMPRQGAYMDWNRQLKGYTYFINHRGKGNGGFHFYNATSNGVLGDALMTLNNNGYLGLGTSTPGAMFHLAGLTEGLPPVILAQTTANSGITAGPAMAFWHDSQSGGRRFLVLSTGSANIGGAGLFQIADQTANQSRLVINSSGYVGIGTTSPSVMLDVNGSVNCTGGTCKSDMRYKRDIIPIDGALSKLSSIRGVYYDWKTDEFPNENFNEKRQIGVIAQEVEVHFPELLYVDNDGYKSVDYMKLSAVLLEATKEQQDIIEDLNSEVEELKNRLAKIEAKLAED